MEDLDGIDFACEGSPESIIHGEIVSVTSAMRRNARWAGTSFSPYGSSISQNHDRLKSSLTTTIGMRNLRNGTHQNIHQTLVSKSKSPSSQGFEDPSGSLMIGFSTLMMELRECQDITQLDAVTLLSPFLAVIRSSETTGPITAIALSSIDKFLTYSLIHLNSPSLALAMSQVSSAGTHCRFEASDSVGDEVVLLKILDVLRNALTGPVGHILTDEAVCEMMETGLSMCCQMRLSEVLRRSAERTMQTMVTSVFQRLKTLPPSVDDTYVSSDDGTTEDDAVKDGLRMTAPDPRSGSIPAASDSLNKERDHARAKSNPPDMVSNENGETPDPPLDTESAEKDPLLESEKEPVQEPEIDEETMILDLSPYGLPSIKELMRVLISLLNPYDTQHTDSMRLTALSILITAFEVSGRSVSRFPSLRAMVSDDLCKHLFQLVRSDNTTLLSASLRCMTNLMDTMRPYLKIHLELFLSYLMDRLRPQPTLTISKLAHANGGKGDIEEQLDGITWKRENGDNALATRPGSSGVGTTRSQAMAPRPGVVATGEARQLMLEHLAHLARASDFMVNLWVNFDCHVDCEDVFERMIRFLARGFYPLNPAYMNAQDTSQLLCLDTLLAHVGHMSSRLESSPLPSVDVPAPVLLARDKSEKRAMLEGAAKFNEKPKVGLKFLEENQIIYDDPSVPRPQSLALFFKTCPKLDKKLLGDFISRPENLEVLQAFMTLFDFRGKLISDCLRDLLETFRLPGESQQIARITEVFAAVYVAAGATEVKTEDAAYVLSYSVIMLNTDQHNPQNRKKMTIEDYKRNLRGVNDGQDFNPDYLKAIFDSIRKREIIMPEEHSGQLGFEYAWKELQRRSRVAGPFITCNTSIFDKAMFEVSWRPVISAFSYAFTNFNDDHMLQRIVAGFQQCATLASRFNLPEVFDQVVLALARITDLTQLPSADTNFPTVSAEGQMLTISPLSIRFGKNFKAQLATVVLFTIANSDGSTMRQGWLCIFEILQSLFAHSILPSALLALPDFSDVGTIALHPPKSPSLAPERRADAGLLSTLSSYLLSPYVGPQDGIGRDITDDDIESTLCAIDCLASCHVAELYEGIFNLHIDIQETIIRTLVGLADQRISKSTRGRLGQPDRNSPPPSPQTHRTAQHYDPCSLFLLELIVAIAAHNPDSLSRLWGAVFEYLSKILANSTAFSPLLVERAIAGLLRLQSLAIQQAVLRDQFFLALDVFRSLPQSILASVAQPMVTGVCQIASAHPHAFRTSTQWNMLFSIFIATAGIEEAARESFAVLKQLSQGELAPGIVADNFAPFVHALNAFASVCGQEVSRPHPGNPKSEDSVTARALESIDMIRNAQDLIPRMLAQAQSDPSKPWASFWMPVLLAYGQQSINGNRELRQLALGNLQRSLVAPEILSSGKIDFTIIFERVLFPVLEELLKPQVFRKDPDGMSETRLRASGLLCKIFLHYLIQLSEQGMGRMTELWLQILGFLDRFMHSGRRDQMYEAVPENLKNVLLVMHASGFLVPPHENPTIEQSHLWNATFERIDPVLNTLKSDLFPTQSIPSSLQQSIPTSLNEKEEVVNDDSENQEKDSEVVDESGAGPSEPVTE